MQVQKFINPESGRINPTHAVGQTKFRNASTMAEIRLEQAMCKDWCQACDRPKSAKSEDTRINKEN